VEVFGGKGAWIDRALPDGQIKRLAHYPADATMLEEVTARWDQSTALGQGPSRRAIRSGFPVVVSDIAADPSLASWRELFLRYRIASLASFPLTSRDETFGVLGVLSDDAAFFSAHRVELFTAFAHQAAAALENARLHGETTDRLDQLESLSKIDLAISSSLDLKITLGVILDQVTARLRVDAADILLLRPPTQMLEYAAGRGFREIRISAARLRLGEKYAGRVASERRTIFIPDLRETQATSHQEAEATPERFLTYLVTREQFVSYAAAPLAAKGQVVGVLEVYNRIAMDPDPTWLAFLEAVAGQAAIAVDNATLFDNLQRSNRDLARAYDTTLEGWSRAMDLRDKETEGHTQRVTDLTVRLGRAMGLREDQVVQLRRGALLHDIGKMGIPDAILLKPDALTTDEWTRMRRHPEHARDLLQPIEYLRPALAIPYAHHEKWDGSGYPQGLRGDQIPLEARIFAIVDVWDALTSDRPYRPAWSKDKALTYPRAKWQALRPEGHRAIRQADWNGNFCVHRLKAATMPVGKRPVSVSGGTPASWCAVCRTRALRAESSRLLACRLVRALDSGTAWSWTRTPHRPMGRRPPALRCRRLTVPLDRLANSPWNVLPNLGLASAPCAPISQAQPLSRSPLPLTSWRHHLEVCDIRQRASQGAVVARVAKPTSQARKRRGGTDRGTAEDDPFAGQHRAEGLRGPLGHPLFLAAHPLVGRGLARHRTDLDRLDRPDCLLYPGGPIRHPPVAP